MQSDSSGYASIVVDDGKLTIAGASADVPTTITSWDPKTGQTVSDAQAHGRAYIRAIASQLNVQYVNFNALPGSGAAAPAVSPGRVRAPSPAQVGRRARRSAVGPTALVSLGDVRASTSTTTSSRVERSGWAEAAPRGPQHRSQSQQHRCAQWWERLRRRSERNRRRSSPTTCRSTMPETDS